MSRLSLIMRRNNASELFKTIKNYRTTSSSNKLTPRLLPPGPVTASSQVEASQSLADDDISKKRRLFASLPPKKILHRRKFSTVANRSLISSDMFAFSRLPMSLMKLETATWCLPQPLLFAAEIPCPPPQPSTVLALLANRQSEASSILLRRARRYPRPELSHCNGEKHVEADPSEAVLLPGGDSYGGRLSGWSPNSKGLLRSSQSYGRAQFEKGRQLWR